MGIWDIISWTAESVNQYAVTPAKNACCNSYSYSRAAVSSIDDSIRENVIPKLNKQLQDEKSRAMMGDFAINCAQNAASFAVRESVKSFPGGGPIYDVVRKSIAPMKKEDTLTAEVKLYKEKTKKLESVVEDYKGETEELRAEVKELKKEISALKGFGERADMINGETESRVDHYYSHEPKAFKQNQQGAIVINFMGNVNKIQPDDAVLRFVTRGFVDVLDGVKPKN